MDRRQYRRFQLDTEKPIVPESPESVVFRALVSCLKERNYPAVRPAVGALTIENAGCNIPSNKKKPPRRLEPERGPVANDGTSIYDYFS